MSTKKEEEDGPTASIMRLANVSAQFCNSISSDKEKPFGEIRTEDIANREPSFSLGGRGLGMALALGSDAQDDDDDEKSRKKSCPKQHQLPMFLSKTYHMIDRCDPNVATWSSSGDNFVVKNVEKFASTILPQYFKHSNFSSFARQLNFYGFRKLKAEPILTADFDARTASYVRFYHEKFQRDKPELLQQIKRATKSDQQSKDDVEGLKIEIAYLKECMSNMSSEFDRKIAELSFDFNRKVSAMSAEYEQLKTALILKNPSLASPDARSLYKPTSLDMMQSLSHVASMRLQHSPAIVTKSQSPLNIAVPREGEKRPAEQDIAPPPTRRKSCT